MYTFAILLFSVFALLEVFNKNIVEKYKSVFAFICYTFLIFHDGFRWQTGSDWNVYYETFQDIIFNTNNASSSFEPGYYLLFYLIRLITSNYTIYLVIQAIIFYSLFFICIFKLSNYPFISILLFYMIIVPYMGMNRQFLAMAIYAIGLIFLSRNQKLYFIISIIVAVLFHRTAVFGLFALIANKNINRKYLIAAMSIALLVAFSGIVSKVTSGLMIVSDSVSADKANAYINSADKISIISTILSLTRKLIWIILLIAFDSRIQNKPKYYYTFFNLYFSGLILYVICNGTPLQIIVSRGLLYFNILEIFMVPYVLMLFKNNYGKILIMVILIIYCFINVYKGFSNYGEGNDYFVPYKGLLINQSYERQDI